MLTPEQSIEEQADNAYFHAYNQIAGGMNRKERRTAHGKLIEANARIAALEAENAVLRQHKDDE
jgi:hypothetical protein